MTNNIRRAHLLFCLLSFVLGAFAQAPAGYYDSTKGRSGKDLKTAFSRIISDHKDIGYDGLWNAYKTTDRRADGKVWDMYSNTTNFTFGNDQDKGNHSAEGDTYNREHSFPQSWFGKARPMKDDVFHVYPTDSYVNGRRGNLPYGETDSPSYSSHNGWSKVGRCSTPGYSGTVFEPNDEYKGDIARTYFYMATAYESRFSSFHSDMLSGDSYPCYKKWVIDMLLRWAKEDPVSQKEIDRNNAAYKVQGNRNPYIDFPGLEQYVWGSNKETAFNPNDYNGGGGTDPEPDPDPATVEAPVFSMGSGVVAPGTEITISSTTAGASIYYTVNSGDLQSGFSPVRYTVNENSDIEAYAMVGENKSETVSVSYTVSEGPATGSDVYVKVNSESELSVGINYLIVCEDEQVAMAGDLSGKKDVRGYAAVTVTDGAITTAVNRDKAPYAFTLSGNAQAYTFYDAANQGYLGLTTDGNKLYTLQENNTDEVRWTVSISSQGTHIRNAKYGKREIMYNSGSPRFATYTGSQQPVVLYKQTVSDGIGFTEIEDGKVDVYSLNGRLLRKQVEKAHAVEGLPQGIYIVGGVKLIIR